MECDVTNVCREKWFQAVFSTYEREGSLDLALGEGRRACEDFLSVSREGMSGRGKKRPLTKADLPVIIPVISADQPGSSQSTRRLNRGALWTSSHDASVIDFPHPLTTYFDVVQKTSNRLQMSLRHLSDWPKPIFRPTAASYAHRRQLLLPLWTATTGTRRVTLLLLVSFATLTIAATTRSLCLGGSRVRAISRRRCLCIGEDNP